MKLALKLDARSNPFNYRFHTYFFPRVAQAPLATTFGAVAAVAGNCLSSSVGQNGCVSASIAGLMVLIPRNGVAGEFRAKGLLRQSPDGDGGGGGA